VLPPSCHAGGRSLSGSDCSVGEWGAMNQVYVTYFPRHLPARSAMGASGLALGARVEIECLATLSGEG